MLMLAHFWAFLHLHGSEISLRDSKSFFFCQFANAGLLLDLPLLESFAPLFFTIVQPAGATFLVVIPRYRHYWCYFAVLKMFLLCSGSDGLCAHPPGPSASLGMANTQQ